MEGERGPLCLQWWDYGEEGQTIKHGEGEREKEMQRRTDAASHQKTLGGSSLPPNPTCHDQEARRKGGPPLPG